MSLFCCKKEKNLVAQENFFLLKCFEVGKVKEITSAHRACLGQEEKSGEREVFLPSLTPLAGPSSCDLGEGSDFMVTPLVPVRGSKSWGRDPSIGG